MQYRLTFSTSAPKRAAAAHPLTDAAGGTLILALFFAPAALGCVRPWAISCLEILLSVAVGLWIAGCFAQRRRPRIPSACLILCGVIVCEGLGALLAGSLRTAPGAVPVSVMGDLLRRLAALLGALLLTCDLAGTYPRWTERLWWSLALTGASLSLFGMMQKMGLTDLATRFMESHEGIPFATFNYHGNAGAFLNIAATLCAGLLLLALRRAPSAPKAVAVTALLLLVCVAGALVNVSRAAQAILVLLLALFAAAALREKLLPGLPVGGTGGRNRKAMLAVTAAALITAAAAALFRGSESARRWAVLGGMVTGDRNARAILAKITVPMAEEAGAWGSGPGSYKVLFPHSRYMRRELYANFIVTEYVPGERISMWSNAHNDYLQTVIEWGWIGGIAWGALLLGGLGRLLLPFVSADFRRVETPEVTALRLSAGLALLGLCLHALVDFPFQVASLQLYASLLLGIAWSKRPEPWACRENSVIISRLRLIL